MNELHLRNYVKELCECSGSIIAWAKDNDLSHSSVSAFLRSERLAGPKLLKKIGVKKVVRYVQKGQKVVMRFEDV